jgi:hypothetical protein
MRFHQVFDRTGAAKAPSWGLGLMTSRMATVAGIRACHTLSAAKDREACPADAAAMTNEASDTVRRHIMSIHPAGEMTV